MEAQLAICSAGDEAYVPFGITALSSFRRFHPEHSFFYLSTPGSVGASGQAQLAAHGITLLEVSLPDAFRDFASPCYPQEVFLDLAAPQALLQLGFRYTLFVDGDVLCTRTIDFANILAKTLGVAGRPVGTLARVCDWKRDETGFPASQREVAEALGLDLEALSHHYELNCGLLYFDNRRMADLRLIETATELFRHFKGHFSHDQDLLAFACGRLRLPVHRLDDRQHFAFQMDSMEFDFGLRRDLQRRRYDEIRAVHFVFQKPWDPPEAPSVAEVHLINLWRAFVLSLFGEDAPAALGELTPLPSPPLKTQIRDRIPRPKALGLAYGRLRMALGRKVQGAPNA